MSRGTTPRPIRFPDDVWTAAVAAFPAERGRPGGLSAEVQGFVAFLGEHPDAWNAVKARAAAEGVDPWRLVSDAVAEYTP